MFFIIVINLMFCLLFWFKIQHDQSNKSGKTISNLIASYFCQLASKWEWDMHKLDVVHFGFFLASTWFCWISVIIIWLGRVKVDWIGRPTSHITYRLICIAIQKLWYKIVTIDSSLIEYHFSSKINWINRKIQLAIPASENWKKIFIHND